MLAAVVSMAAWWGFRGAAQPHGEPSCAQGFRGAGQRQATGNRVAHPGEAGVWRFFMTRVRVGEMAVEVRWPGGGTVREKFEIKKGRSMVSFVLSNGHFEKIE